MFKILASLTVAAVAAVPSSPAAAAPVIAPSGPAAVTTGGVMQVVAHQDDDLFFMNPDVHRSITSGMPSVTVYLTAGEMTGDGMSAADRARNRQRGAQNAYATMAGVADKDDATQREWEGDAWQVGDKSLERYWLRERPGVRLVFLNLPDGGMESVNKGLALATVLPMGGLVAESTRYTRANVVTVLHGLIAECQPLLLRTQDAEPDQRVRMSMGMLGPSHPDHVNGGLLAREAAARYTGPLFEVAYRDYNTSDSQANLAPSDATRKSAIVGQYYAFDRGFQRSHLGDVWLDRQYYRWSRGTEWATLGADGRVEAFVVHHGQLRRYVRVGADSWSAPSQLPSVPGGLALGVAVGHEADGRLAVFGHRLSDHHILVLRQTAPSGQFPATWTDLGRPDPGSSGAELIGSPVVASNADGRLQVFVRNARDGVSTLTQVAPSGTWEGSAWASLPGSDVQDGLSVVATAERGIELFASTRTRLLHWRQSRIGGAFQLDSSFPDSRTASPPRAVVDAAGLVQVAYLQPGTADVKLISQDSAEPSAWSAPISIGGTGETSQPAMTLAPAGTTGRVMLFARNQNSGISASVQARQNGGYGLWSDVGGTVFDQPAAVTDASGEALVLAVGPKGVSAARVSVSGERPSLGPWLTLDPAAEAEAR